MENEKYENFKKFILVDHKLKKEIIDMRPPLETDSLNDATIVKYTDNAYDSLKYIIRSLKQIIAPYDREGLFTKKIDELSKVWLTKFINCKLDLDKLRIFYRDFVTDMNEDLVASVKSEFGGYMIMKNIQKPLSKCHTINEILHTMHFYVMNDERNLQSLNLIDKKKVNHDYYPLSLYGEPNDLATAIYQNFPPELDVAWTDIVSFGNTGKIIMMIRDRGHALSIEIDSAQDDVLISYFIPKLCNIEMINNLPGVIKVKENTDIFSGTTGRFATTKEKLCEDLYNFISKVPTDDDIPEIREFRGIKLS